jgi:hypothetical protein
MASWLGFLPRSRFIRFLFVAFCAVILAVLSLVTVVFTAVLLWQNPKAQSWVMLRMLRHGMDQPAQAPPEARISKAETALLLTNTSALKTATDLFGPTNIWDVQLHFTSNQWAGLGPTHVQPVAGFLQPDGSVILRNPNATRNGLSGVFGLDFPWSTADLQFGEQRFQNAGARFKGNGTFVDSQRSYKRPFKVELNKHAKGMRLAGIKTLNFHNLTADASCLRDTLAYEFFREAGVPASRTAFARMRLSIDGRFADRLLGLYLLVENPDAKWAESQWGSADIALFKPVTYDLFKDLGNDWNRYQGIYDPKTKVTPGQTRRLIELARLMTHGSDGEFSERIAQFIDVDEFARFLACQVILSNYDGPLSDGQNFLIYLDPRTERFGFVPWDLDHSWGEFKFLGTVRQKEEASVWHPWVGENRFLERMLRVNAVRECYRKELQRIRTTLFIPERLSKRFSELAEVVRPFIAEESASRLARFQQEIADPPLTNSAPHSYSFKRFITERAASIDQQLQGASNGVILTRRQSR